MFYDWSWTSLLLWTLFNVLPMWWTFYTSQHLGYNAARDAKYDAWVRHDYKNWSYLWAIPLNFLFWPRLLGTQLVVTLLAVIGALLDIGCDTSKTFSGWRRSVFDVLAKFLLRFYTLCTGCVWQSYNRHYMDYSKYLGPDWRCTYEGAGIHVMNH